MATSDKTAALQVYYINKYEDVLWVIVRLGGVILQQQLCRWLHNNSSDATSNTQLIKNLEEAQLIRKVSKIGSNSLIILTYPVFQYFNINRTVKINGVKIKRSAMVMEKYLTLGYYTKEPLALKKRMEKTSALYYMPTCQNHLRLIQKYINVLQDKGWCVDGLKHQEQILYKRFDYHIKLGLYENYTPLQLDKEEYELDLYNLECQNSYLTGARFDTSNEKEQFIVYADIYNVYGKDALTIGKLVMNTQRTLESIFADYRNNNFADIYINIYSHYAYTKEYEDKVYSYLCAQSEYIGNEELARERIKLVWLNTRTTLFSNIDPSSIV